MGLFWAYNWEIKQIERRLIMKNNKWIFFLAMKAKKVAVGKHNIYYIKDIDEYFAIDEKNDYKVIYKLNKDELIEILDNGNITNNEYDRLTKTFRYSADETDYNITKGDKVIIFGTIYNKEDDNYYLFVIRSDGFFAYKNKYQDDDKPEIQMIDYFEGIDIVRDKLKKFKVKERKSINKMLDELEIDN